MLIFSIAGIGLSLTTIRNARLLQIRLVIHSNRDEKKETSIRLPATKKKASLTSEEIIETALQRDFDACIMDVDRLIQKWKSHKMDNRQII